MSDTQTHPLDSLHKVLLAVVARIPWHSEAQQQEVTDLLRQSEVDLKGDAIDSHPAVVPPSPPAGPAASPLAMVAGPEFDYDKLAAAMLKAQKEQEEAASEQMAQAHEAVAANPGWTPPGAATGATAESHAGADALTQ